jgi:hypothetical protein
LPFVTSHTRIVRSAPALASDALSPRNVTALTQSVWPTRHHSCFRFRTSQTLTVLSSPAEASRDPSGLKAKPLMSSFACPRNSPASEPIARFHKRTTPSEPPLAARSPRGLTTADWTPPRCVPISFEGVSQQRRLW